MTDRLAHLYDRELFALVEDEFDKKPRRLSDILIHPKDDPGFNPKYRNWRRRRQSADSDSQCDDPQHQPQLAVHRQLYGEPPSRVAASEIEANDRLRRMYYEDAPAAYRK